jgi:MoxR-like ATPase
MSTRFEGTETFVATDDLMVAVNAAVALERPLLIKGRARYRQNRFSR